MIDISRDFRVESVDGLGYIVRQARLDDDGVYETDDDIILAFTNIGDLLSALHEAAK